MIWLRKQQSYLFSDCAFFLVMISTNFGHFHQSLNSPSEPSWRSRAVVAGMLCWTPRSVGGGEGKAFVWDFESRTREQGSILWWFWKCRSLVITERAKRGRGGLLGATFSQFHGGKGPGAGNLSSSGIQPRSNLQEKDTFESVFRMMQKFQFLHRQRLGSLCS